MNDSNSNSNNDSDDLPTRSDVLDGLGVAIHEAREKVENGRVRDAENEKVRQGWIQALCRAAGEYRKMLADAEDLAELRERVEAIEDDRSRNPYRFK